MKKSILNIVSIVVIALSMNSFNLIAKTNAPEFLYNTLLSSNNVIIKEVCKLEGGTYKLHVKNEYNYNAAGELESITTSRWNEKKHSWENSHRIMYNKDEIMNSLTIELLKWNLLTEAYDLDVEKSIYHLSSNNLISSYVHMAKDASGIHWDIKEYMPLPNMLANQ